MKLHLALALFATWDEPQVAPPKAPPPPPLPAATQQVSRQSFLQQYDRDGDGRLVAAELPEDLRKFHGRSDRNADGFLDADEIMRARNTLGQQARRMDNLKMGLQGRLKERGKSSHAGINLGALAGEWLRRMDFNGDGYVDDSEMRAVVERPELILDAMGLRSPEGRIAIPVPNGAARLPENKDAPIAASHAGDAPIPQGRAASSDRERAQSVNPASPPVEPDEHTPDGLPTVNTILKHLDKNQNEAVDRSEAVDQLRDHFNFLDKNKDGKLDRGELERSLKLARMFGGKARATPAQKAASKR